jgi:hypothetical protein
MTKESKNSSIKRVYKAVDITMHLAGGSYFIERDGISIARFTNKEDRDYILDLALKAEKE